MALSGKPGRRWPAPQVRQNGRGELFQGLQLVVRQAQRGSWRYSAAGITMERMRAALVAIMPLKESSSVMQRSGSLPSRSAAIR